MNHTFKQIRDSLRGVIRGGDETIDHLIVATLAGGHVLLEDIPGVGKTTLAKALAATMNLVFSRISFTPDLLPGDLLGTSILNPKDASFTFHEGPVFTNILLADEINRASPRTQSALLEAMNEQQVSIDKETRPLASPFLVIATQNPLEHQGTYPLPEAQMDRFLMRLSIGYPDPGQEMEILYDRKSEDPLDGVSGIISAEELCDAQSSVKEVNVSKDVGKYMLTLVNETRNLSHVQTGASPRASLSLFRACQALAYSHDRDFVTPEDVQTLFLPVIEHRLTMTNASKWGGETPHGLLQDILEQTKVPL